MDVIGSADPLPPCSIFGIRGCGLGLTKHGFFLCGAGASIARVCGLDIGVMRLADVTWDAMLKQAEQLCMLCGHHETVLNEPKDCEVSPFWENAFAAWRREKPQLPLYGDCHNA